MRPSDKEQGKRIVAAGYDRVANVWDRYFVPLTAAARGQLLQMARLKRGERVLDVGTGTAATAILAGRRVGPTGRVLGIDTSREMLRKARENAAESGLRNVTFRRMDAASMRLPDASFDAVISTFGTPESPVDAQAALTEWRRVLAIGGRLCFCDGARDDKWSVRIDEVFEKYKVRNPGPKLAERRRLRARLRKAAKSVPQFDWQPPSAMKRLLASAGFADVRHLRKTFVATVPDTREFLDFFVPWEYGAEYAALSRAVQDAFRREVREALRSLETRTGLRLSNGVGFFFARKRTR